MKIAILFDNLGPYHIARLTALGNHCNLLVVEQSATSKEYSWDSTGNVPFRRFTLFNDAISSQRGSAKEVCQGISRVLSEFHPDVVVVPGWATNQAIAAVIWATKNNISVIVMSDSQEIDFPRKFSSEWIKRRYISLCNGAFVAGTPHLDYLVKLGMNPSLIRLGYDVVDNDYFRVSARMARDRAPVLRKELGLPLNYFLTSARFIEKKNLSRMIEAFSSFKQLALFDDWHLVIMGDGPLRSELEQKIAALNLSGSVLMPGFKQYSELPHYYALAAAFILPSTTEQWGLVVNEAMASGLPVLVSARCGSTHNLVQEGVNGYAFDPYDLGALTGLMVKIAHDDHHRCKMGQASSEIIKEWSPQVFASNLVELAKLVKTPTKSMPNWFDRLLLKGMLNRLSSSTG